MGDFEAPWQRPHKQERHPRPPQANWRIRCVTFVLLTQPLQHDAVVHERQLAVQDIPGWQSAPACGGMLRWIGMAFDPPALMLAALQLLHGLSFGATHLGALMFLARHAQPAQAATAQGYLAIAPDGLSLYVAGTTGRVGRMIRFSNSASMTPPRKK